ncbi:MAG: hypothetical protein U5R48_10030 [Gammaproteobacteria bacterium]|nr:hypothetical protein [Gammaproteobacteria bacterium]
MEYRKLEEVEQRALLTARYISLETFRRDGRGVATPVWCAEADGILYLFSAGDAGKVKRIRGRERSTASPAATFAAASPARGSRPGRGSSPTRTSRRRRTRPCCGAMAGRCD